MQQQEQCLKVWNRLLAEGCQKLSVTMDLLSSLQFLLHFCVTIIHMTTRILVHHPPLNGAAEHMVRNLKSSS
jgi:hypothetical protein